ncbi:uncharacterized protein LOC111331177 [Stylophora pistillata]|nr:uncharacterized protein LOC111331177 [Stylophora pistillata]
MRLLLLTALLFSLTLFKFGDGEESKEENVSDISLTREDHEIDDLKSFEDDDQPDDSAKDRWLAPELYDEIEKRSKRKNKSTPAPTGSPKGEGQEELPKKKNEGGGNKSNKNKTNKKNRPAKNKFTEKETPLWFEPLGCYKDYGPLAWKRPWLRDIATLYKNGRRIIDWRLDNFRDPIIRCAQAAQARGYPCFGVQFYGECWGSINACETYNSYGKSSNCIKGVGIYWANFVYKGRCGSAFGCCPDNAMPALGLKYKGCPDCTTAVNIVLIIDSSGSIGKKNFNIMRQILLKLVRHFSISDSYARVALVQYATTARTIFSFKKSQRRGILELQRRIWKMRYTRGRTKTGKALALAAKMLRTAKRFNRKIVKHYQEAIVFTDGVTDLSDAKRFKAAAPALKAISHVIACGVQGKGYNAKERKQQREELGKIASSEKDVIYKASFQKLLKRVDPIARLACPLNKNRKLV